MKRISRWLFSALTVGSLLLCVGTVALWVRTYFATDEFAFYRPSGPDSVTGTNPEGETFTFRYHETTAAGYHFVTARGELGFYMPMVDFLRHDGKRWAKTVGPPQGIYFPDPPGAFGFYASGGTAMKTDPVDPSAPPIGDFFAGARYFFMPAWFVAGILAILSGIWLWRLRRQRLKVSAMFSRGV